MTRDPIFVLWTRSFWAFMATAALITEMGEPIVRALATLLAPHLGKDVEVATQWGMDVLPLLTLMVAMHQRSGAARPYTIDPRAK